jgi:hypothetical protein
VIDVTVRLRLRLLRDRLLVALCVLALLAAIVPLIWVLWDVVAIGAANVSWSS